MDKILNRYENEYGYVPSISELYDMYTQGELSLNDTDENTLLKAVENARY